MIGNPSMNRRHRDDPLYPLYHFVSPAGDTHPFDPNGAIYWKGRYHLFYIFQDDPDGTHGYGYNCCWGHVSSPDLLHWTQHPVALRPGGGDDRCYSGSALVNREGVPTLIYNGGAGICIATSADDDLATWEKHPRNPVIPRGSDVHGWQEGGITYALLGGSGVVELMALKDGKTGEGDTADLYRSANLVDWELMHRFYQGDRRWTDAPEDCACPDFFPLGDRFVLAFMSHYRGAQYYLGRCEHGRFIPEQHGRMNWEGGSLIAPESLLDGQGRRVFWAWACETRNGSAQKKAGWSGVLTLPRVLSLDPCGELRIEPVAELERLRRHARTREDFDPEDGACLVCGDCLELELEVEPGHAEQFILKVLATPDDSEATRVVVDFRRKTLAVDASRASLSPDIYHPWPNPWSAHHPMGRYAGGDIRVQAAPFELRTGERLRLRVFLDRSILEVYANARQCVTQRVYPTRADARGVSVSSEGGPVHIRRFHAWDMAPIGE